MMDQQLYQQLNKSWKSACRILLGEEIGQLEEYKDWLTRNRRPIEKRKSHISGKDIALSQTDYCKIAKFVSLDEMGTYAVDPLNINEIKDIDSVLEAISEKWEYTGNKTLGNSRFIENSDNVFDSHYVLESSDIRESSEVFYSSFVNEGSKHVFGCYWIGKSEFVVKSSAYNSKRCFEAQSVNDSSDVFFSYYALGCSDVMFCFNQRNKRNAIGNLQLTKDKYLALKQKLLSEVKEELKKSKWFPSIFELIPNEMPKRKVDLGITQKVIANLKSNATTT